ERLFAPVLDQWHPGQPHLVEIVMRRPDSDNAAGSVANITQLAAAGYRTADAQVSEMTGLQVSSTDTPHLPQIGTALNSLRVRYAPTMLYPPARAAFERAVNARSAAEQPLSRGELAALAPLEAGQLSADGISHRAATAYTLLRQAVQPCASAEVTQGGEEEEETAENWNDKRDSRGRFAAQGFHRKGGSASKGNPKNPTTKSNTPLIAAPGAKVQAQVDATEHALKAKEGGGGVVQGAAWVKGKRLDVPGGSPDTGGAAHMTKHYKPGDTSRREAAKDANLGRKKQDRTELASLGKRNKVILADKGDHLEIVTTRRKTDHE
ncbi:MAG: hypothetical protein ACI4OS_06660, partial [Akkermansia sp.]